MDTPILLATDLDRTLLPNGAQPESPLARHRFRRLATRPEVRLAYVTGRHRELVKAAMAEYELPRPDFVIADVGTSLYETSADDWRPLLDWQRTITVDWGGRSRSELTAMVGELPGLRLQEMAKQGACKLSYYAPPLADPTELLDCVRQRLAASGVSVNLVWSSDETTATGLLDVLPASASKRHALEFLRARLRIPLDRTVFAGDSGNDLDVLVSDIPSVLVANAQAAVRAAATAQADAANLHLARGGLFGMNGNYSAGILEGVVHFIPETRTWLMLADEAADTSIGVRRIESEREKE
ncbi:MAG: HAD-IIB family hydrolase [Thiobacillus sp.]|jgi:sucrose-6F-phosphate phosphohydrolase|uniref:HAD-IIB family hydrolase n=1 Tax=Thiobacillus sp. TaxID=924 RepID=UPI00289606A5|nr:HAD-IIB family hydrolase [Thiobacillus sp.]MDT3705568.1 HAD-IIB family hydrolase [Thiobacillus sp.]